MISQEQIQDAWNDIAPGFDEFVTPPNMDLADAALRRAGLRSGMRVLDVAAGSGALSIPAARRGARVLATDIAPAMVERLDVRAREEGLSNLEGRVMDGHALELEDDSFDITGSQFGVMLFPDMPRGLSEMVRVTKSGGRVLTVVMGPPTEVEFLGFFVSGVKAVVSDFEGLPMDPTPLPFQASDPEKLRQRLTESGLTDVRVETANHRLEFRSGAELWDWMVSSNPIGAGMVADLTAKQKASAQKALDDKIHERSGGNGPAVLNNSVNIGIGTKRKRDTFTG